VLAGGDVPLEARWRPHLAGWSGGGKAALEFATEYPDRVRSLTLVEPAGYWILEQLWDRLEDVECANSLVQEPVGRPVRTTMPSSS
jgi:pimeloyl-ACP methyl ester carboxylesterase